MTYFLQIHEECPHIVEVVYIEEVSVVLIHDRFQDGVGHHWGISLCVKEAELFSLVPILITLIERGHFFPIEPEGSRNTFVKIL